MKTYLTIFKRAFKAYSTHNDSSYAAAIAYHAIFSIFPVLLVLLSLIGFFIHSQEQRDSIVNGLFSTLGSNVSKDALRSQVDVVAGGSAGLGIIGFLVAAWSSTGVFDQLRIGLGVVWSVNKERPVVQQKLIDAGMLVSIGALVLLSMLSAGILTALSKFGSELLGRTLGSGVHALFLVASILVPGLLLFIAFSLLYWLVPHAEVKLRHVWLGALFSAVAFEAVQLLFAYYVANLGHYSKTYGALGGIIAFLFFIYIAANVVLLGGEVAKEYIDVKEGAKAPVDEAQPQPKQSLLDRAEDFAKGLVVDTSPHHDPSLPYEPGRTEPVRPNAPLLTNEEADRRPPDGQQHMARSRNELGDQPHALSNSQAPATVSLSSSPSVQESNLYLDLEPDTDSPVAQDLQAVGDDFKGMGSAGTGAVAFSTALALLSLYGVYEALHKLTGMELGPIERWKHVRTRRSERHQRHSRVLRPAR
jgi:membrane protein